jgi:NIMA (never in mitosis gene a)-related kinase
MADFEIKSKIGSGSFGVVYKCTRKADGKNYVIKTISIAELSQKEQLEAANEVKILATMDSAVVVRYYDSFVEDKVLNIVMEYCDRGDLKNLIDKHVAAKKRLREDDIWSLFLQIALGLHYIHSKRVLHRDVKTANVFLCKGSRPVAKLGDLGVARVMSTCTNFAKTIIGTPYYLSPELCEDKPYNAKRDIWALGIIL